VIKNELKAFDEELEDKNEIIALSKIDLSKSDSDLNKKIKALEKTGRLVVPISIEDENSLKILREKMFEAVQ
jgi:GTPase involved in cell partitioning and DNA repair